MQMTVRFRTSFTSCGSNSPVAAVPKRKDGLGRIRGAKARQVRFIMSKIRFFSVDEKLILTFLHLRR